LKFKQNHRITGKRSRRKEARRTTGFCHVVDHKGGVCGVFAATYMVRDR
jgi:hypothetical protein